jgi:DNA polymerase-1
MRVTFGRAAYEFRPWRPGDGRVMARTFAFDTETTRIDEARPWVTPAYVLGAAFDGRRGVFVTRERVGDFLRAHEGLAVVAHHAVFDLRVIHQVCPELDVYKAVDENRVWDTVLLYRLLALGTDGTVAGGTGKATLERLTRRYLGVELPKDVTDADGDPVRLSYGKWLGRPPHEIPGVYLRYLALDAVATLWLYVALRRRLGAMLRSSAGTWGFVSRRWLREQVTRYGPQTHHTQLRAAVVLDAISANGLRVDPDRRDALAAALAAEVGRLKTELAGHGHLPGGKGSDKALQAIITRLAARRPDVAWPRTAGGKYATRKEVLEDLAAHVPFVDLLLEYRAASKLLTSFVDKIGTGVVHTRFRTLTRSGRTSSYGQLNVQNLPRAAGVRECFVPSPGHVLLAADYSTIELVTLAQACEAQFGFESHMAAAIRAGQDLHRVVAGQVTGKPPGEITDDERAKAKPINFGKPGGMGDATLRGYARLNYGVEMSEEEVAKLSGAWFAAFPEMRRFLADEREAVWGRVAGVLGLTAAGHAAATGDRRFLWHATAGGRRPNRYLGAMALKVAGDPEPRRQRDGRPYPEADVGYLWDRLAAVADRLPGDVRGMVARREPGFRLRRAIRSLCDRAGVFTLTGRLRAGTGYCQRHNTVFQGLAADGAKRALWRLWRAGFRLVNFVHDEVIAEVPEGADLTAAAERVKALMVEGMREVVPDLPVRVEYAVMARWSKDAEARFDPSGRLLVWEPEAGPAPGPAAEHPASGSGPGSGPTAPDLAAAR